MAKARQQYFADEVTLQKENRDFAIQPELVEKLEGIEAGAQVNVIETVKVNGEALIPDENKAVDVSVPLVEDTLYSTDTDKALSANQGKVLYEYIQNLASRGRYLSNWNTVTGLPSTSPVDNPYQYHPGDYYVVSNVAAEGGTNYRPDGSSYSWGVASTTVETETVRVGDYYTYDGQHWLLLVNTSREIAVDSSLSTSSTNPVENRVITNALNTKQNNITDLETIRSGAALGATALQPGAGLSELTGTSDDITQGTTNLFMTTAERSKLSNQSGVNTGDETQTTIKNKLGQASASTDGYLTSTDWNAFNNKQGTISDLETIRSNASAGKNASDTIATYGDVVTHDANEFATASQGAKADTALQSGDNVSELVNDAGYITDAYHDSTKQDKLIAGANIQIAADGKTISATDTTYVAGDFDIKDLADTTGLRTEWSGKQDELIAGNNIQIAADGKTISATDTTYTAGPGISISNNNVISNTQTSAEWGNITGTLSDQTDLNTALGGKQDALTAGNNVTIENICSNDMQGPCPDGFHVPLNTEWQTVYDIWTSLGGGSSDGTNFGIALKLPFAGLRNYSSAGVIGQGTFGNYWSSSHYNTNYAYVLLLNSTALNPQSYSSRAYGYSVRCFKNSPTVPTSTWTKLYGTSIESGGIFWSSTDGLISLSSDGQTWVTIADKNLGATQVWNSGDAVTASNCGDYYQWGNNYGFPFDGNVTTSSTQVDASNYGPGNYYSSSTFITSDAEPYAWDSSDNENLWGGVSQGQSCALTISSHDTTYTAGTGISIDSNNVISNTQTSAEWGNISGTLSNQTDLQTALDAKQDDMVILSYGHSTWNDFITAYQKNGVVYCRASSQSNPATGSQGRLAFMAYVNNADNPTEVEFQYYRSRSDHNSAANQLDEVYVYKLVPTSGGTWTVTQRNTAAKATAGTGINLTYGSGNMTIANTGVTSINSQTGDVTLTIPTVPTNVSDFVNDAGYITANDLPTVDTSMSDSSTNAVQNNVIKNYVDTQVQEATSGAVSDTAYGSSWDGITGIAPSKNAVYDKISAMDTTIAGKQDTISDLSTIRTGAGKGATAVQPGDNVSTLTNDAGFITKAVNDLTNYYTKSETYTKAEVADYVANFAGFKVVATLPTTDIKTTIIYLLGPVGTGADKYEEYIYSNNTWVMIGETSVDLTNYFNTSTDNSDSITEGSTNLFLTSAERTKLSNTSGTNTGDETKATIQSKLGAATSNNDGYLTSADWSTFNSKQNALTAGDNIDITNNVISATGLQDKLTAGDNITITESCESDMQGPCDSGFHIPLKSEWEGLKTIMTSLSLTTGAQYKTNLHMPFVGYRAYSDGLVRNQANSGDYWASNIEAAGRQNAYYMSLYSSDRNIEYNYFGYGYSIRAFKNEYVAPTSNWTVIAGTLGNAGIFWNSTDGLITVTNGTTGYTIQDKNVGATTVYNDGDTLSEANMGNLFQRGNNYGFSSSTSVTPTTSTTQVDTSSYGPENPYYSSTYIIDNKNWQSTTNGDLWGGESLGTHCQSTISSNTNTNTFLLPSQGDDISDIITLLNNGGGVVFYKTYSELATVVGTRYYVVTDYNKQQGIIKAEGDIANATITLTSGTTTVASVTTGGENVKKFSLSSTSDITTAEKVVDWYNGGNIPVVVYNGYSYTFQSYQYNSQNGKSYYTFWAGVSSTDDTSTSSLKNKKLTITYNPNGIIKTDIAEGDYPFSTYLRTGVDYSTPYTPEYNGSPATKKYVDDSVSGKANTSDITAKTYYTTGTMSVETFMDILNGLAASHIAPIIVYASNTTDIYYYDTGNVATTSVSLYFYAPSNGVSNGTLYNKKLTVTYNMTAGTVTLTKSNENLAISTLPSQTSQSGKFLTTDGTTASWANVDALPTQTGQSGKFLTTNGTTASWANVPGLQLDSSSPITVSKLRVGTEAQYQALSTKSNDTIYMTV